LDFPKKPSKPTSTLNTHLPHIARPHSQEKLFSFFWVFFFFFLFSFSFCYRSVFLTHKTLFPPLGYGSPPTPIWLNQVFFWAGPIPFSPVLKAKAVFSKGFFVYDFLRGRSCEDVIHERLFVFLDLQRTAHPPNLFFLLRPSLLGTVRRFASYHPPPLVLAAIIVPETGPGYGAAFLRPIPPRHGPA